MRTLETTVTEKGQVTVPVNVRRSLGLKPHDKVVFVVEGDRAVLKRAPSRLLAGYGAVTPLQKPEDFRAIRDAFEQAVADEVAEEMR